ncbi:MAG: 2Fe-2S iron-sulfur cluster-binding protein, partial [Acidimicrobiia bacterium]|nr:2Fe-2S iron-sulfur cluster-binding protein [Acidimicrobiia bacterium]
MTTTPLDQTGFVVNGEPASVRADHPHLLAALREELNITSPKDGCSPSGHCGACTVLVDGKAIQSCLVGLEKAAGKEITTLEGFPAEDRARLANAFAAAGALQCGFCTPGIMVRTKALLDQKGKDLTRETAAGRLGGHLCRCTGYTKIFEAIEMLRDDAIPDVVMPGGVGTRGAKYQATELALGDRGYVDDMRPDGLLHAALKLSDHARADVLRIDTGPALAIEGVIAVFTAADVPGELRVGIIYEDWPVFIPEGG